MAPSLRRLVLSLSCIFVVFTVAAEAYSCPAGLDCVGQQVCGDIRVSCTPGFFCPGSKPGTASNGLIGAVNEASVCREGFYCPNPNVTLPCPAGSICRPGSVQPTECRALSFCPENSFQQRYLVPILTAAIVSAFFALCGGLVSLHSYLRSKRATVPARVIKTVQREEALPIPSALFSSKPQLNISFSNIGLVLNGTGSSGPRTILKGVSGKFRSGRVTAIMGPSGSGKTTLINVLTGKVQGTSGSILINNQPVSLADFSKLVGFVPQEDVMPRMLTVEDNLTHSALTRLPADWSLAAKLELRNAVLEVLNLKHVRHSVIGNELVRGVSGGERKRVNIGMELVADPSIIFLDEPTSGLDSTSSQKVLYSLRKVAHKGINVVSVIHQPRFEILELFDDLLLLGKGGQTVYFGATSEALPYIESLGFHLPPHSNPADFFLDVISGEVPREDDPDFQPAHLFDMWREFESRSAGVKAKAIVPPPSRILEDKGSSSSPVPSAAVPAPIVVEKDGAEDSLRRNDTDPVINVAPTPAPMPIAILPAPTLPLESIPPSSFAASSGAPLTRDSLAVTAPVHTHSSSSYLNPSAHKRSTPNLFLTVVFYMWRCLKMDWRDVSSLLKDCLVQIVCGAGIGVSSLNQVLYEPPLPMDIAQLCPEVVKTRCINEAVISENLPTNLFFFTMIAGVSAAVSGTRSFENKAVIFREVSSGVNPLAIFIAQFVYDVWHVFRTCLLFNVLYFFIAAPEGSAEVFFFIVFLIQYCAFGLGNFLAVVTRSDKSVVLAAVIAVAFAVTSGLSPQLKSIDVFGPFQILWFISYNRWGAEALLINATSGYDKAFRVDDSLRLVGYNPDNVATDFGALVAIGVAWRIATFLAFYIPLYVEKRRRRAN